MRNSVQINAAKQHECKKNENLANLGHGVTIFANLGHGRLKLISNFFCARLPLCKHT